MEQTYQYPNLLTGTRSGEGWTSSGHAPHASGYIEDIGALYIRGTAAEESFLSSPPVVLHKDTDYTLHCFAANTTNMSSTELFVFDIAGGSSSYEWIGAHAALKTPGPGGAWLDATFRLDARARDGGPFWIRFDNNGSTDGKNCLIWFRDVMLVEGTEPHAWAPAEGEVWPG